MQRITRQRNSLRRVSYVRACALALCAAVLPASAASAETVLAQDTSSIMTVDPAAAPRAPAAPRDWRKETGTFRIGLVRGWSTDMSPPLIARLEQAVAGALGMPVRVVTFDRFTSLIDAQAQGAIDYAAYSARAYAAGRLACECLEALMRPTSATGSTGQVAMLVGDAARMAGPADGMRIGRIGGGWAGASMAAGALSLAGATVDGDEPFWRDFADVASMQAAYAGGELDAYLHIEAAPAESVSYGAAHGARAAETLWTSQPWFHGPHAMRANAPAEARDLMRRFLAGLETRDPALHALLSEGLDGPFAPAAPEDYAAVTRAVRHLAESGG